MPLEAVVDGGIGRVTADRCVKARAGGGIVSVTVGAGGTLEARADGGIGSATAGGTLEAMADGRARLVMALRTT